MTTSRRPLGSLEAGVLEILWADDAPLTPADVLERLDADLAYTTVMTILTRLWNKGLADRMKTGRAYSYSATTSEAGFVAARMRQTLDASSDRMATMGQFLDGLDEQQHQQLRKLLEDRSS